MNIRVETVFDKDSGKFRVELYFPEDSPDPFVRSESIYQSHEAAADDVISIMKSSLPK